MTPPQLLMLAALLGGVALLAVAAWPERKTEHNPQRSA